MQLRKLALAVGLASVLGSDIASALGLGEIKLNSTLNQPLDAEIKLLQTRDLGTNEILVGLASREEFSRAGVDRSYNLIDLKFTVNLNAPGGPVVKVTSEKAIQEPYLNFLLETQWPSGRLLREYTLLLDLPVFADAPAAPVQQSTTTSGSTPPASRSTSSRPTSSSASSSTPSSSSSPSYRSSSSQYQGDEYGPVSSADTLWDIALKVRPGRNFSVQQTMLAIQRLNPEAFINNNINLLRKGQVLRVPSADQITAVSKGQAVNEVAYQNASWTDKSPTTGPQLEGRSMAVSEEAPVSTPEGRLKLSSGGGLSNEASGRTDGVANGDTDALQNDLAASLEELDRSKRENTELKDRVSELEAQIQTMERLVSVSSEQLRALQLASEGRSDQETSPAVTEELVTADAESEALVSTTDELGNIDSEEIKSDSDVASAEAAPMAEQKPTPAPVTSAQPVDVSKVVVSSSSSQDKSLLDIVFDNIAIVGAALLALILGLVLFLRKRSQQEADSDDDYLFVEETEAPLDDMESEVVQEFDLDEELDEAVAPEEIVAEEEGEPGIEPETGDVVSEADIYIAYGKLDQAEEILTRAIERDGTHTAARLKLMEVFAEQNNLAAFDEQYREIVGDPEVEERAEELRLQFGGAAPFVAAATTAAAVALSVNDGNDVELDAEDDFDLSLDLDADDVAVAKDTADLTEDSDEVVPDFDLGDFELDADKEIDTEADNLASKSGSEAVEVLDDDFSLDLEDLDFSDIEDAEAEVDDGIVLNLDEDSFALGEESELSLTDEAVNEDTELNLVDPDVLDELSLEFSTDDDLVELKDSELSDSELDVTPLEDHLDSSEEDKESVDDELGITLDDAVLTADAEEFSIDFSLEDEADSLPEAQKQSDLDAEEIVDTASDSFDVEDDFTPDSDEFDLDALELDADLEALDSEVDALAEELDTAPKAVSVEESADELKTDLDLDSDFEFESTVSQEEEALFDEALSLDIDSAIDDETTDEVDEEFDLAADLGLDLESEDEVSTDFDDVLGDLPTSTEEDLAADAYDEDELDSELDFLADTDESSTKLDLARAYIDMGDSEGAKDILSEVVEEGNPQQKQEAEELMERLS